MLFREIENPQLNPEEVRYRRWSYLVKDGMDRRWLIDKLERNSVTPVKHQKVCDLCSGDGSIPAILVDNGWKPGQITCIDQFKSPEPLVEGVDWKYLDISLLVWAIRRGAEIPEDLKKLQHSFDLVTLFQSHAGMDIDAEACKYFAKPGGYILCP